LLKNSTRRKRVTQPRREICMYACRPLPECYSVELTRYSTYDAQRKCSMLEKDFQAQRAALQRETRAALSKALRELSKAQKVRCWHGIKCSCRRSGGLMNTFVWFCRSATRTNASAWKSTKTTSIWWKRPTDERPSFCRAGRSTRLNCNSS